MNTMIKFLSSSRITVLCLFLLFVLTFWGTIAQVQQGLYAAQERYFNSFFFLAAGFIPFPGAQSVLWLFFINLICMMALTIKKLARRENAGLLIIHLGLILYFFAAFMVFHVYKESAVRLAEGEGSNISASYQDWELGYWTGGNNSKMRDVTAFDTTDFKPGYQVPFSDQNFHLTVRKFYLNSGAELKKDPSILNVSGISGLIRKPLIKEREQNIQGGVFELVADHQSHTLLLYGAEGQATPVNIHGEKYYFILRHKRYQMPFTITLEHFKAEFHPGTAIAKSFESTVLLSTGSLQRQVRIYMNNPLRYRDYTVYQASYDTDEDGRQYSTLAVVKNSARVLPYIACLVVFFGLALHFLIQAFTARGRT